MIFKEHDGIMNVDIHNDEIEVTKSVVRSFDYDTCKFTYKLTKNGVPLSLSGASKVNVTLKFGNEAKAVLDATTVDTIESIISFVYPEQYLGYSGRVLGEVSIQYDNGQTMVAGYFGFVSKGSYIDEAGKEIPQFYWERFEDAEGLAKETIELIEKNKVVKDSDFQEAIGKTASKKEVEALKKEVDTKATKQETDNKLEKKTNNDTFVAITSDLQRQIESTQSGMLGEFNSVEELNKDYPNGTKGYAVVWLDEGGEKVGYSYTYKNNNWVKGQVWSGMGIPDNSVGSTKIINESITIPKMNFKNDFTNSFVFEKGHINPSDGKNQPSDIRYRTPLFYEVKVGDYIELVNADYKYNVFLYDLNNKFIKSNAIHGTWETGKFVFDGNYMIKIGIGRNDNKPVDYYYLINWNEILSLSNSKYPFITESNQLKNGIIGIEHLNFDVANQGRYSFLYSKILAVIGDSISARNWWQKMMEEILGVKTHNYAVGGSTISKIDGYPVKSFVERMYDLPAYLDYLIIWGLINDFGFGGKYGSGTGVPLGTFDSRDPYTFYGALHVLFEYIIPQFKNIGTKIGFIITTPVSKEMGMTEKNDKGYYLKDYCNAAREVCEYYSIPYLDFQKNSGISELNVDVMTSNSTSTATDGLHPSIKWFEMKKYALVNFLESL